MFLSDGRIKVSTGGEELLAARLYSELQVHKVEKFPGKTSLQVNAARR